MTRVLLGIVVSTAAAAVTLAAVSAIAAVYWRLHERSIARLPPRRRAQRLAALRLLPLLHAILAALVTLVAFLLYEPLQVTEQLGGILPAIAGAAVLSAAVGVQRVLRALHQTNYTIAAWAAEPTTSVRALPVFAVDAPFPVVAVVGVWKPRLLVARQVVARCDRVELEAMIAHEIAHVDARDNITRLLFAGVPVVPFTSRAFHEIEDAWVRASEESADDEARRDTGAALALASALTKVARLAAPPAPLIHASAILSGNGVEHRVRRLLEPPPRPAPTRRWLWRLVTLAGVAALFSTPVLHATYELAEYCVRNLP